MFFYPHHIGDFVRDTARLSDSQCMAYLRLLWQYYDTETPLPNDHEKLAFQIGASASDVSQIMGHFFTLDGSVYRHDRCDKVISEYHSKAEKAKASANARWKNADAMRTQCERTADEPQNDANQEPITDNHKPTTVPKGTGGKPPLVTDPNEIIFGYGLPMLTTAGTAEKQARSFLGGLRKRHGDEALIDKLRECARAKPLQPLEWLAAALPPATAGPKLNKQESLEASNRAVGERFLKEGYVPGR